MAKALGKDGFIKNIKDSELAEGAMHATHIRGNQILLAKVGGEVYGVSNRCPHMGCQLQGGTLNDYIVMCPCHGWKFDVRNGQYTENHLTALTTFKCKVEDGHVWVEIKK
ncbi:MAG: Rieske (2Fe-2S) protein [Candidatus Bathyarchaeia archaeon]|jgi:3-phenylpropionate/trans-cinnamate dioxygenase ferredoxin subunit